VQKRSSFVLLWKQQHLRQIAVNFEAKKGLHISDLVILEAAFIFRKQASFL